MTGGAPYYLMEQFSSWVIYRIVIQLARSPRIDKRASSMVDMSQNVKFYNVCQAGVFLTVQVFM